MKKRYKNSLKFSDKNDEKIFTIFLIILAVASFSLFLGEQYISLKYSLYENQTFIDLFKEKSLTNNEIISIAKNYIDSKNIIENIDSYNTAVAYFESNNEYSFLKKSLSDKETYNYIEKYDLSLSYYAVRFYKEYVEEEIVVYIDEYSGKILGFKHYIPIENNYSELSKEEAEKLSSNLITELRYDIKGFIENDYSKKSNQGRIDHEFTFRLDDSVIHTEYGDSFMLFSINILGDKIGGYDYYLSVPEEFNKDTDKQLNSGNLLALISIFATLIMFILAAIVLIKRFILKKVNWKFFMILSIICLVLLVLELLNSYPIYNYNYMTNLSYTVYIGTILIVSLIMIIISCISIFVTGAAGESLSKEIWKNKIKDITDFSKKKFFSKNISKSILRGYLIAMLSLGVTSLIYILGNRFLGVWSISSTNIGPSTLSFLPFFSVFVVSLVSASIVEEFTYRFFGITFFKKYAKSTFLAILIPTIIWAVAHSNYAVFPIYFRGIELLITGFIFGYFFLRYNITTVIIAHYLIDVVYMGLALIITGNLIMMSGEIFILIFPLIIAIIGLIKKEK
jgi:membrane protease YdiL (CAAX protease family)